jgi:hypothetical protein
MWFAVRRRRVGGPEVARVLLGILSDRRCRGANGCSLLAFVDDLHLAGMMHKTQRQAFSARTVRLEIA